MLILEQFLQSLPESRWVWDRWHQRGALDVVVKLTEEFVEVDLPMKEGSPFQRLDERKKSGEPIVRRVIGKKRGEP